MPRLYVVLSKVLASNEIPERCFYAAFCAELKYFKKRPKLFVETNLMGTKSDKHLSLPLGS